MIHNKLNINYILTLVVLLLYCACGSTRQNKPKDFTDNKIDNTIVLNPETVNSYNWYLPPYKNWAFKNMKSIFSTNSIPAGTTTRNFKENFISFDSLNIKQRNGQVINFQQHLKTNNTDALLVLHKGEIVAEYYFGNMNKNSYHNWFSISKSLVGTVVGILAAENRIDLSQQLTYYLPELRDSAWDGASVQTVLDMLTSIEFNEDYHDPNSDLYTFGKVTGFVEIPNHKPPYDSVLKYLKTTKNEENTPHDTIFHYVSLNTEVLGMLIYKVTGKSPSTIISNKVWSKMGANKMAYIVKDSRGHELVSASINSTLRDAGRYGQLLLEKGVYNNEAIIPSAFITTIENGGNVAHFNPSEEGQEFKNFSYKNQWWHTDKNGFFAKGLFGQWLFIQPNIETVIVKFSTSEVPSDPWHNDYQLIQEICNKIERIKLKY